MANKLLTYMMVMSGLVLLFYFTGLLQECTYDGLCESKTPNSALLDILLKPEKINTGSLALQVTILLGALAVASVTIGYFSSNVELAARSVFGIWLLALLWDFLYIAAKVASINSVIAVLLFGPLLLTFIITFIDWIGKND